MGFSRCKLLWDHVSDTATWHPKKNPWRQFKRDMLLAQRQQVDLATLMPWFHHGDPTEFLCVKPLIYPLVMTNSLPW